MKVKEGEVLTCQCGDCDLELTVTKACSTEACGEECDLDATCCGKPLAMKGKGCCS